MADLGEPIRVIEVAPLELPIPEVPELDPVPEQEPAKVPEEVPA